jgi:transposase-like protein
LYLKGLSEADFHTVYSAVYGDEIKGLSQSTISHLVHAWDHEFNEWNKRDMSDEIYPYLWCDGIYFSVRNDKANKCQLVIVGVNENGQKKLVANGESYSESDDGWTALFLRLKHQGMPDPKLLIGDAGLGLWAGLKGVYPDCSRQHCWFHKQLNIRKLLPKSQQTYATHLVRSIYNSDTKEEALKQAKLFYDTFSGKYPKAVSSLKDNINNLLTFYDFPARHWTQIRTSNIIESLFSTVRARTNVTRGKLSSSKIEILVFKLAQIASKRMNAIPAADELKMVIAGKMYKDGVMVAAKGGKI